MNPEIHFSHDKNGFFKLTNLGLLKVSGPRALELLQGQLSCDVNTITSGHGSIGAHCNPQGRIISLFYLTRIHDDFYLVMPQQLMAIASAALKKYAAFFKAEISNATGSYQLLGAFSDNEISAASAEIQLPAPASRKIIFMPASFEAHASLTDEDWKLMDMLDGIPAIYPETSGLFLPHDINLPALNAVSFSKGCFTGQEIIARMHYRGKPKKHLYRALSPEKLAAVDELYLDGKPAATVIDCSENVYNKLYAILLMTDETTAMKHELQTKQGHLIQIQQSE